MAKYELTKKLLTGISVIDKQHKEFIAACTALADAVGNSDAYPAVKKAVAALEKKAIAHFKTEGGLMKDSEYPAKAGHYKLHEYFYDELKVIDKIAASGRTGPDFAKEINERLTGWFLLHIEKNDLKMAGYVKEKK